MSLEEAILDVVRRLPEAKQEEVLRFADGLDRRPIVKTVPVSHRYAEQQWISRNRAKYEGQWVAIEGDRLVAAGLDALQVYAAAKAEGIEAPFVMHLVPEDDLPFVPGW
jgi:hypothetical protein